MAKEKIQKNIVIKNRKASYEYEFLETYTAGMSLLGSEIKSIRLGKASLQEAYCYITLKNEVFIKKMHIAPYEQATHVNHEPYRERKLLLQKKEINKLVGMMNEKGLAIIPVKLFISERGMAKLVIALGKGKKLPDKRSSIKDKDNKRELQRQLII